MKLMIDRNQRIVNYKVLIFSCLSLHVSNTNSDQKSPDISSVLKALNHPVRREIILFLDKPGKIGSFSDLHEHVLRHTKSTGQFSYHLKLLLDAKIIEKKGDRYNLTKFGERAAGMIQLIDLELDTSIAQKINSSYESLSPTELVFISWMIVPILFFVIMMSEVSNIGLNSSDIMFLYILSVLILISSAVIAFSKLQYIPSLLVLSNVLWIFFLPRDHLKLGRIYVLAGIGAGFTLNTVLVTYDILLLILGFFFLITAIILSYTYIKSESRKILEIRIK